MELLALPASPLLLLTAVVAAAALLLSAARLRKSRRYHPVVGSILHQLRHIRRFYQYHTELSRHHKTYRIRTAPFRSDVYTNDPAVVEYILRTNFHNYGKGMMSELMKDLLGDGIFAVDGSKWRHQRKLASHEFTTRSLRENSGDVFKKNAAKLAAVMSEAASSHQAVEMQVNPVKWCPPLVGYSLTVDGACKGNSGQCGGGGCTWDEDDGLLFSFSYYYGPENSILAEVQTLCDGLSYDLGKGVKFDVIYSDSVQVVHDAIKPWLWYRSGYRTCINSMYN